MDLRRPLSLWRVFSMLADTLRQAVGAVLTVAEWEARPDVLRAGFQETPRRRPSQAALALYFFQSETCAR